MMMMKAIMCGLLGSVFLVKGQDTLTTTVDVSTQPMGTLNDEVPNTATGLPIRPGLRPFAYGDYGYMNTGFGSFGGYGGYYSHLNGRHNYGSYPSSYQSYPFGDYRESYPFGRGSYAPSPSYAQYYNSMMGYSSYPQNPPPRWGYNSYSYQPQMMGYNQFGYPTVPEATDVELDENGYPAFANGFAYGRDPATYMPQYPNYSPLTGGYFGFQA